MGIPFFLAGKAPDFKQGYEARAVVFMFAVLSVEVLAAGKTRPCHGMMVAKILTGRVLGL